jgi:hypothetical protein
MTFTQGAFGMKWIGPRVRLGAVPRTERFLGDADRNIVTSHYATRAISTTALPPTSILVFTMRLVYVKNYVLPMHLYCRNLS